jgi:segregation and condensation protein B
VSRQRLALRVAEAVLFAAEEPLDEPTIQEHLSALPEPVPHAADVLRDLAADYEGRGVRLERRGGRWAFRTDPELAPYLERYRRRIRRLSPAALETLAIIAYHQPVTRAELEEIRGVSVSAGTLDLLVETGWVAPQGRKPKPGKPVTWVTTPAFLDHFDLKSLDDLPRIEELTEPGLFGRGGDEEAEAEGTPGEQDEERA